MSENVFYADIDLTDENFYLRFWTRDEDGIEKNYDWLIEDLIWKNTEQDQQTSLHEAAMMIMQMQSDIDQFRLENAEMREALNIVSQDATVMELTYDAVHTVLVKYKE